MKIDIHFHMTGNGKDLKKIQEDVYFNPDDNNLFFTRVLYNLVSEELMRMEGDLDRDGQISTQEYINLCYKVVSDSEELDAVVILGLDGLFSPKTGLLDEKKTDLWVSNCFLSKVVRELNDRAGKETDPAKVKKFFYGASVSPNRANWEEEMDTVVKDPYAVLMKLIPSTQHVTLMDSRHTELYKTLAQHRLPLLCHVGPEYSFPEGIRKKRLDNFRFLEKPLDCGVTVIAAHCATPVFPVIDRNEIREFYRFMKAANSGGVKLYGDTSAFSLSTRLPILQEVLETFPPEWLVNGSDFPIPIDGWAHLPFFSPDVDIREYINIQKTVNPLDKDVRIKRAFGFSDSILENGGEVLRLP
ncbi:MAG: amidohydrolase family protein [Thermodesulfovibrionales bacterium]|jgi:hypothetical protein